MENYLELLIFLAFAAFSFFSQFLNKKRNPSRGDGEEFEGARQPEKPVVDPEETRPRQPSTFEDILREMMGENKPQPTPPPKVRKKVQKVETEAKEKLREVKQTAKKATLIAEKISLEDSGKRIKPIELAPQKNSIAQEVSEALSNPKSAREAIILSEIINRKYF